MDEENSFYQPLNLNEMDYESMYTKIAPANKKVRADVI